MNRPDAPPELTTGLDSPGDLAELVRSDQWPFKGFTIVRDELPGLVLDGGVIEDTDLDIDILTSPRWQNLLIRRCRFACHQISEANIRRTRFEECEFVGGTIRGGSWREITFADCTFSEVRIEQATFHEVRFERGVLDTVTADDVRAESLHFADVVVTALAGFAVTARGLAIAGGRVSGAKIGGGTWSSVSLGHVELSEIELARAACSDVDVADSTIVNCSQSEGSMARLRIGRALRVFGLTFSAVAVTDFSLTQSPDVAFLAILRSVVRNLILLESRLRDTSIRSSRLDEPVRVERCEMDGLDLSESEIAELPLIGGKLDGPVRFDRSRIRRWTLTDTEVGAALSFSAQHAELSESDPRVAGST